MTSLLRQQWLENAISELRPRFEAVAPEFPLPPAVRVSWGFPGGRGGVGRKAIGQCWAVQASKDGTTEIFLSPVLGNGGSGDGTGNPPELTILAVLAHELVHAAVGLECKHRGAFRKVALAIGLEGKMTATTPSPEFKAWAAPALERLNAFPSGALDPSASGKPKQSTRLVKCQCPTCGYPVRATRKWLDAAGAPICPVDGQVMKFEAEPEEGEGEE